MFDIQEELKKLPAKPGVYIMHDVHDDIIYVGKAIILKNRVRQYFQSSRNHTPKIRQMVSHVARFEYIITDSELEALVLECNLIKEHRPKYNTMLKDDKTYPYIKVTVGEAFPRIMLVRSMKKDKAKYFGPYTSSQSVRDIIDLSQKIYKSAAAIGVCRRRQAMTGLAFIIIWDSVRHHARAIFPRKSIMKMFARCCIFSGAILNRSSRC